MIKNKKNGIKNLYKKFFKNLKKYTKIFKIIKDKI